MTSITTAYETYLLTISGVTSLVGSGTAARIFKRSRVRQGTAKPFVIIRAGGGGVSFERLNDGGLTGKAMTPMHVWACAETHDLAFSLSEAIRLAPTQGYRGLMGPLKVSVSANNHSDDGEEYTNEGTDKPNYYWVRIVYRITHDMATAA